MLLKYFNSNRISVFLVILLLPVAFWIPSLFQGSYVHAFESFGIIPGSWTEVFSRDFRWISSLLALALVLMNGYFILQLNTIHIFIPGRTQLPLLFYLLLVVTMKPLHQMTTVLAASLFLVFALYRIFDAYKVEGLALNFLDAGILVALAGILYLPSLVFFFFILSVISILRAFNWREWAFAFIGLFIPYCFMFSVYYLADVPISNYFERMAGVFQNRPVSLDLSQIIFWSYTGVLFLAASYYMVRSIGNMKIQARKFFLVFLVYFLFSAIIFLVIPGSGLEMNYFTAVPLAYLFAHYFTRCRKNWANEGILIVFLVLWLWLRL